MAKKIMEASVDYGDKKIRYDGEKIYFITDFPSGIDFLSEEFEEIYNWLKACEALSCFAE